jgi:hypothetical protein
MSWNNITPIWTLYPIRVIGNYLDGRPVREGFMTIEEANIWIKNENNLGDEYRILQDENSS